MRLVRHPYHAGVRHHAGVLPDAGVLHHAGVVDHAGVLHHAGVLDHAGVLHNAVVRRRPPPGWRRPAWRRRGSSGGAAGGSPRTYIVNAINCVPIVFPGRMCPDAKNDVWGIFSQTKLRLGGTTESKDLARY